VVDDGFDRGMSWALLALAAVVPITASFNNTFIKLKLPHAQPLPMTALMLGAAGVMLLPLELSPPTMAALDLSGPMNPTITPMMLVYMLLLGVVATGVSTVAFFYMVLERGPLFAGMTTYVVPMLALAWGGFDHETISLRQLFAMAGVLVMVGIVQMGTPRALESYETLPAELPDGQPSPVSPPLAARPERSRAVPAMLDAADSSAVSTSATGT
jgi:drug/metabolite transporter (DMT)-like permease